jgi:chromosome segregation ATPase
MKKLNNSLTAIFLSISIQNYSMLNLFKIEFLKNQYSKQKQVEILNKDKNDLEKILNTLEGTIQSSIMTKKYLEKALDDLKNKIKLSNIKINNLEKKLNNFDFQNKDSNEKIQKLEEKLLESTQKNKECDQSNENLNKEIIFLNQKLLESTERKKNIQQEIMKLKNITTKIKNNEIQMWDNFEEKLPENVLKELYKTFPLFFNYCKNHKTSIELLIFFFAGLPHFDNRCEVAITERITALYKMAQTLNNNNIIIYIDEGVYQSFKVLFNNYTSLKQLGSTINLAFMFLEAFTDLRKNLFSALDKVFITTKNTNKKTIQIIWQDTNSIKTNSPEVNSLIDNIFHGNHNGCLNTVLTEKKYKYEDTVPLQNFIKNILLCKEN